MQHVAKTTEGSSADLWRHVTLNISGQVRPVYEQGVDNRVVIQDIVTRGAK